ncbi:MAG: beta-N-acetylglucosaminidase domain-containing protein [Armatimonadota bacterium]
MRRRAALLMTLAPILFAATAALAQPVQLLGNGGFEYGDWEWRSVWGHAGHRVVSDEARSGRACMYFDRAGAISSQRYRYDGGPIEVRGWYRTKDVVPGERSYWDWSILVNFIGEDGEVIKHLDPVHVKGTHPWQPFRWRTDSAPDGTAKIELSVALQNATGEAWVDDLQLIADGGLDLPAWRLEDQPHYTGEIMPRPQRVSYGRTVPIWDGDRAAPAVAVRAGDGSRGAVCGEELLGFRLDACSRYMRFNSPELPPATPVIVHLGRLDDAHIQQAARIIDADLPGTLPPQGHVVRMRDSGESLRIVAAGVDEMGVAYAAASIYQMIGFEGEQLVLRTFELTDWPDLLWRASSDYGPIEETILRRMVAQKMSMYAIQHRAWWKLVGPDGRPAHSRSGGWDYPLGAMREFAERSGAIDYMMLVHIYVDGGRPAEQTGPVFDIASEDDVTDLIERLQWVYDQGIHTIMVCVDDYVRARDGEYQFHTEAEAERFRSVGASHGYLMRRVYDALAPNSPDLRLSIVSAPYSTSHLGRQVTQEAGERYLRDMAEEMPEEVAVVWTGPRITSPKITRADWRAYEALVPGQPLYLWDNMQAGLPIPKYAVDYYPQLPDDSAWSLLYQNSHFVGWPSHVAPALAANDWMWQPLGYDIDAAHREACLKAFGRIDYTDIETVNQAFERAKGLLRGAEPERLLEIVDETYAAVERLEAVGVPMAVPKRSLAGEGVTPDIRERLGAIPSAKIARVDEAPEIDGTLDDAAWEVATEIGPLVRHDSGEPLGEYFGTEVRVAHDGETLYVACRCQHEGVQLHSHENAGIRDGAIFFNSDTIELFIGPDADEAVYYHLAVDHTNTKYDERRPSPGADWDGGWQSAVEKTDDAWTLEMAIPLLELGADDPLTTPWRLNICRAFGQQSQLSCWGPTWGSFHNWPFFGRVTLRE